MPDLGQPNGEVCNPTVRRERSDASLSAILKWGLGLAMGAVVVLFILWWLFDYFSARENRKTARAKNMMSASHAPNHGETLPCRASETPSREVA